MRGIGKIIGAGLGFMAGRWPGLLFGILIGHSYDRGAGHTFSKNENKLEGLQSEFSNATFLVMGKLAKSDGRVNDRELDLARNIMSRLGLNEDQRLEAMRLFSEGKQDDFNIVPILESLKQLIGRRHALSQFFLETQLSLAYADGALNSGEKKVLQRICANLGINKIQFEIINKRVTAQFNFQRYRQQKASSASTGQLNDAYTILDVKKSDSDLDIKKAYRKLMNQHHPDKLVARGLPPEMQVLAKEKSQEIQQAYTLIRKSRKA